MSTPSSRARTIRILLALAAVSTVLYPQSTHALSIAIIDYADAYSETTGLAQSLDDLGFGYTDLTANLLAGDPLDLSGADTFIIGSFCTQNATIKAALSSAGGAMNDFVAEGGTIIMLSQADQDRAPERWMGAPAAARRCDADFNTIFKVQGSHQIFNKPNAITDANLSGWLYKNNWPSSWESLDLFRGMGVLAGNAAADPSLATFLEAGWGSGRVILAAMAPDKARNIGNPQALAQAPRLLRNLLQYAQDVRDAVVQPVVLYENPLRVAIIENQDTWSNTKGLGQLLTDLGQSYTDLTAGVLGGGAINLSGYNTFIIGSHTAQNNTLATALTNAKATLTGFVNGGGMVLMLTQADQNRSNEDWLATPANVVRGDPDYDAVLQFQPDHQVFHSPNEITPANLTGWEYLGTQAWPTSWESFTTFQNVGILAADNVTSPTLATMVEANWGYGRAVLAALAPDKARNIGNAQAKAQAPRIMRNLLQLARDQQNGRAAPVVVNNGTGPYFGEIRGWVFNDTNGNNVRDPGEPPIAGAGVSDTVDLVLTAADGSYVIPNSSNSATLLYVCIPSGYRKDANWFRRIHGGSGSSDLNFALTASDETGPFEFVQVTDIHVGSSGNRQLYTNALAQINQLTNPPELILATGDLVENGSVSTQYVDYVAAIATSTVPVFNIFGNHDADGGKSNNYRNYLGPDYYSFNYGNCHFLIINSVHTTPEQTAWINTDLAQLRGNRKLFIFQHYPPNEAQFAQYVNFQADAVFTGHWHSQHTVKAGQMNSYNSSNLLFGGIDCSPASFKVIAVHGESVTTRTRYMTDGKRLQIVSPNQDQLIARSNIPLVVNAYQTESDITSVSYAISRNGQQITAGLLAAEGDWSWTGRLTGTTLPAGSYDIAVTAVDDKGEQSVASAGFTVTNRKLANPDVTGNWSQFGGGPARGGLAGSATLSPPLGIAWTTYTGGNFDVGSPTLHDGALFVGVKDRGDFNRNGVLSLDATDGSTRWFAPTPAAVSHAVAVDGTRALAASHDGRLHWFDQNTGQPIRSAILGSTTQRYQYSTPVLNADRLFVGTFGYFAAFDRISGTELWNQNYGSDWISSNAAPATNGSIVVVPANWASNSLIGVSAATGQVIWRYAIQGLHGSPVIVGDRVVFTTYNGKLAAVSLTSGTQLWLVNLTGPSATTPAISGNTVVAGGAGSIQAVRLDNGQSLWSVPLSTSALKMSPYNNAFAALPGSPTILGDTVYMPCGDGRLYALNLSTGAVQWSMNFGAPILSAPCISGNALFLTAFDGRVYALVDRSALYSPADFDRDRDVDQADALHLLDCITGTGTAPATPGCVDADLDADQDIDQSDFGYLQRCLSGRDIPAHPDCAD